MSGGKNIRHYRIQISNTELDFFTSLFEDDIDTTALWRLRVIVTNAAQIRMNINNCADGIGELHGILVDYEHPWNEAMPITSLSAIRIGSTDAICEVTVWYD